MARPAARLQARATPRRARRLDELIEPRTDPAGSDVSDTFEVPEGGDEAVAKSFETEQTELASGGYRASARGLVIAMLKLQSHGFAVVDKMAWRNDGGRLFHNGSTGGGMSTASMYPPGLTIDGVDHGGVSVAVVVNVSDCKLPDKSSLSSAIIDLSKRLAALVNTSTA